MSYGKLTTFISLATFILAVIFLLTRGLNLSVEFTGGTLMEVEYASAQGADLNKVRHSLDTLKMGEIQVQALGTNKHIMIRLPNREDLSSAQLSNQVMDVLKKDSSDVSLRQVEFIGPAVGDELVSHGLTALGMVVFGIIIYLAMRFEWRFAVSAIIANMHDVVVILGCFALFQWEFSLTVLAGILAVLGYSVNESVVVFDRIRENIHKPAMRGKTIPQIRQLMTLNVSILHIRRGDTDMPLTQSLRMEIGDQIGVLAEVGHTKELQRFFGDSVKAGGEVNYLSMGVGVALGLAVGSIAFPIPGLGNVKLGLAGLLLVALYLGKARNTWKFTWSMPIAASRVFREFGLALFLAQVGMASGSTFVETVAKSGMTYLLLGVALVALLSISVLLITVYVFRIPYDMAAGIISGATGNPAILAFSSKTLASDKPDVGYAMIFPSMTVFKILLVQIIGAFM